MEWEKSLEEVQEGTEEDNLEDIGENNWVERLQGTWERRQRMAVIQLVCYVIHAFALIRIIGHLEYIDRPIASNNREKDCVRQELMTKGVKRVRLNGYVSS
ncbi:unnamed protein product [Ilex paraguariensis]|uniref:Uncharacterized protein n=1 Tax=Ilex paraguariensis TaxID=185542 RepID=A0ABC8TPS7_9AQUA